MQGNLTTAHGQESNIAAYRFDTVSRGHNPHIASQGPDRYEPLPPFTKLPRWLLGKLSRRARIRLGVATVVAVALLAIGVSAQVRSGHRDVETADAALDRRKTARQEALAEDQRPRRVRLPAGTADPGSAAVVDALEGGVRRDMRVRVRAGLLDGPVRSVACEPVRRSRTATTAAFFCFARQTGARSNYEIEVGYQFSAKADLRTGSAAWCKRNPRPLHPDTAYYKVPPVSPSCLPG